MPTFQIGNQDPEDCGSGLGVLQRVSNRAKMRTTLPKACPLMPGSSRPHPSSPLCSAEPQFTKDPSQEVLAALLCGKENDMQVEG